jgi:hypothetical protein
LNDSVHIQFNVAVDPFGNAMMRIGTTGSAGVILQNGSSDAADHGWGWTARQARRGCERKWGD